MNLHSLFAPSRLTPKWSFTASHILWRFLVSDTGMILGEDRDTDAKHVTFFCIEMQTGTVLWRGKSFGESWWTGVEALIGDRLYLHGFAKPDMPEHHGLTAIDARTGNELWSNKDISFYAADDTRVIGFRDLFERRVFEQFDAGTGASLGELESVDAATHALRDRTFGRTDFLFPEPLPDAEPAKQLIEHVLASTHASSPDERTPIIEYVRNNGRIIFSAHMPNTGKGTLLNILSIVDEPARKELFRETLNAETPYPVGDSFFIDNDTLYYIKEKRTLVSLPLA
jgi:hypothetical protein